MQVDEEWEMSKVCSFFFGGTLAYMSRELSNNELTSLPSGIFESQASLKYL